VNPALRTNLFLQYGRLTTNAGNGATTTNALVASASLTYQFTETLSGWLQYSYTSNAETSQQTSVPASLVALGLRKTF
jgi:predicted porin